MIEWIYILIVVFIIFVSYIVFYLVKQSTYIENGITLVLDKRINYQKRELERSQNEIFRLKLREWIQDNEFEIRRKAISMSNTEILGRISADINILKNNFNFNPKDIKFIGRFIDLIIFDGAADDEKVNIYFVEIQKPNQKSSRNMKVKVETAIKNKRVTFQEINL